MKLSYNPFDKKNIVKTEYGIINYQHDMGTVYVTHRQPQHFFRKFQGFAISVSELEVCFEAQVYWLMVIYTNKDGEQQPYRMRMQDVRYLHDYDNKGDLQKVMPLIKMERLSDGRWV